MKNKNYSKQILELLDSKGNLGLTSREIAEIIKISEDMDDNLKYVRQYLGRLRKRQKILVININENRKRVYSSLTWLIETFEKIAFEDPEEKERTKGFKIGIEYMIEIMGYVKKEDLTSEDLIYDDSVEIFNSY